jgi:hypothetical protein
MTDKTGGPAFPSIWENLSDTPKFTPDGEVAAPGEKRMLYGMTLRDYFAAKAMAVFLASVKQSYPESAIVRDAYTMADAMLKAREK